MKTIGLPISHKENERRRALGCGFETIDYINENKGGVITNVC